MNSKEIIVMPNVHGRTFWKDAVSVNEDALANFIEIVEFAGIASRWVTENEVVRNLLNHCLSPDGEVEWVDVAPVNDVWRKDPEVIIAFMNAFHQVSFRRGGGYAAYVPII